MKSVIAFVLFVGFSAPSVWAEQVPSVNYEYDKYGNCKAITKLSANNTILEKSTYEYDAYRRTTAYTEAKGTPQERTWKWHYDRYSESTLLRDASTHTSKQWRVQVGPAFNAAGDRSLTARKFDFNDRILEEVTGMIESASGAWNTGPDTEIHFFSYDANGNKKTYTDPRGRLTEYEHDRRNRLTKTTEPLSRVTETVYDTTGNKTLVKFPDTRTQQWLDYDPFGQAWTFIDERNNTTNLTYQWGPMKKLHTVTTHRDKDGGGTEDQHTRFEYDRMGRPVWTFFPDNSTELRTYEFGQVNAFKTRKNQTKRLYYDARGREISHTWDMEATTGVEAAPEVSRSWDDANRVLTLCNVYSTIDFGYDGGGLTLWEGNTIAGSGARRQTTFHRYPAGPISDIQYPNGMWVHRDYTARGQLKGIDQSGDGSSWQPVIDYAYHPDGKVWYQDYGNGVRTSFDYDGRGFMSSVHNHRLSPYGNLSHRTYHRDLRDRIYAWQKSTDNSHNPKENGRGDRYQYDAEGQLWEAIYEASNPVANGDGAQRYEGFNYDAMGNRRQNNHLGRWGWTWFTRRDNGLNQYLDWGVPIQHDGNGDTTQDGWITASYNALNQPVSMTSPTSGGTMWFGYDPAGRCVKRWVGPSGAATSNPATYLYYDGWNLIEEGSSATSPSRNYVHGARVDEIVLSLNPATGERAYHHYDARTHAIVLTNSSGGILEQYEYDVFGQPYVFTANGTSMGESQYGNRFLFTGREWLKGLDIYDFRHRMYQQELGRFLQPDPIQFAAGDYNLYRYCHNDPVNKSDPDGTLAWFVAIPLWMAADWAYDKYAAEHVSKFVADNFSKETAGNLRTAGTAIDTARTLKNPAKAAGKLFSKEPRQLARGKLAHKAEQVRAGEKAEVRTPSGRRMDRYNEEDAHIREIKPNNARGLKAGDRQLKDYKAEMDPATGRDHTTELTTYEVPTPVDRP